MFCRLHVRPRVDRGVLDDLKVRSKKVVKIADWLRENCHVLARCWRDADEVPVGLIDGFSLSLSGYTCAGSVLTFSSVLTLRRKLTTLLRLMGT